MKITKLYVMSDSMTETIIGAFGAETVDAAKRECINILRRFGLGDKPFPFSLTGVELSVVVNGATDEDCSIYIPTKYSELSSAFSVEKIDDVSSIYDDFLSLGSEEKKNNEVRN